jgi:inositol-pentakisphosphate 2-kinase
MISVASPPVLIASAAIALSLFLFVRIFRRFTPPSMTATTPDLSAVPLLPDGIELSYLAEGAANIIYRLTPASAFTHARLLRLRKTLPSAQPNLQAYHYLSHTALPLFPSHLLVKTTLIRLPPDLLAAENARLKQLEAEGKRPKKRAGMYLETEEEFGFLVADMTPHSPRQLLVEFKPKWVVQSPSAPATAKCCRTCALRLKKGAKEGFCPLDLASGEKTRVQQALGYLLPTKAPKGFEVRGSWEEERGRLEEKVVAWVLESELMPVLKGLQERLDPDGPLGDMGERFTDAMTVRDLTVFLRVDMDVDGAVECGVGDLDMKTMEGGKREYWMDTERGLIEEGWYDGREGGVCEL